MLMLAFLTIAAGIDRPLPPDRHGVAIEAANFDATGNPGLVNASQTLAHPAGS